LNFERAPLILQRELEKKKKKTGAVWFSGARVWAIWKITCRAWAAQKIWNLWEAWSSSGQSTGWSGLGNLAK
jgi:hypothetical protein